MLVVAKIRLLLLLGTTVSALGCAGHGSAATELNDYPTDARAEAQTSLNLHPNVPAYLVLARLDLQANEMAASASNVSKALQLEPKDSAAQGMRQALQARGQSLP